LIITLALNLKLNPIKFIDHFQAFLLTQLQGLTVLEQIAQLIVQIMFMDQGMHMIMDTLWDMDMDGDAVTEADTDTVMDVKSN
jgi:Na+/pantothenate symporter